MQDIQIDALRRAACALLETATNPTTLRTVLRALLDEPPDEPLRINGGADRPHSAANPQPAPALSTSHLGEVEYQSPGLPCAPYPAPATTDALVGEAWLTLRSNVRDAMRERGITTEALAEQLGGSRITATVALGRRSPPTKRMQQRLADWLSRGAVAVPEVAAPVAAFRGNGHASRTPG